MAVATEAEAEKRFNLRTGSRRAASFPGAAGPGPVVPVMGYLLDTNVLNAPESPVMRRLRQHRPGDVAVSAFVIHELFYSIRHSASSATSGTPIGPYDILIAGQALARGLILVTHNTGEFSRLPGLRTEDWQA